jgi:outer membrane protein
LKFMKNFLFGFLVFFFMVATPVQAQMKLSLKDGICLALKNNEKLRQVKEDQESAHDRVKEVKGALFPKLEASYNYNRYFDIKDIPQYYNVAPDMTSDGNYVGHQDPGASIGPDNPAGWHTVPLYGPYKDDNEHTAAITASQVLFTSGRLINYLRAAKTGSLGADLFYSSAKRNLVFLVQEAYMNVILAQYALEIADKSLNDSLNDYQIIKKKLDDGLASDFDAMQQEVTVQNFRVKLNKADNNLILSKNHLKVVVSLRFEETLNLTDSFIDKFPVFDFEYLLEEMLKHEPTLKALEKQIKASHYLLKATKADYFPMLAAFARAQRSGDSEDFSPDSDELDNTVMAGVTLTIPIYEGGTKSSKVSQALHDLNKARLEHKKIKKLLKLDLQNAYLSYVSSQNELKTATGTVKVAKKAYELAQLRYEVGLGSRTDLEDASLALANTRLLYYRSKRDVNLFLYKIQSYILPIRSML